MWIRKSDQEIQNLLAQQQAKQKSLLRPFLFASLLTGIALILYAFGYRGGWLRGGVVVLSNESALNLRTLISGVFLFAIFFALALYRRRSQPSHSPNDILLCRECKQPANAGSLAMCNCGGTLEPFAFFSWVEDEKANQGASS